MQATGKDTCAQACERLANVEKLTVLGGAVQAVVGEYYPQDAAQMPMAFFAGCNPNKVWKQLNTNIWFKHTKNDSYIYYNKKDMMWQIAGPDGMPVFTVSGPCDAAGAWHEPPAQGWQARQQELKVPTVYMSQNSERVH